MHDMGAWGGAAAGELLGKVTKELLTVKSGLRR
jgi:hypothetical protein